MVILERCSVPVLLSPQNRHRTPIQPVGADAAKDRSWQTAALEAGFESRARHER